MPYYLARETMKVKVVDYNAPESGHRVTVCPSCAEEMLQDDVWPRDASVTDAGTQVSLEST